jgi:hypothetical protein
MQAYVLRFPYLDLPSPRWDRVNRPSLGTCHREPVSESAAFLAETAAMLPETFSKEREATIQQLLTAMEQQQGVMRELVGEVRQSLEAVPKASDSIRGVLDGTDALPDAGHQ